MHLRTHVLWSLCHVAYCFVFSLAEHRFVVLVIKERERERNINEWFPLTRPLLGTGDLAGNPGICPDWESNLRPFGLQASTQSTELCCPTYRCRHLADFYIVPDPGSNPQPWITGRDDALTN